ncbi:MAG: hypothetical protein WAV07_16490 [Candidatus Contendobacter sp.]
MEKSIAGGFRLTNPAVQVFERKAKPDAAIPPAPEPKAPEAPASPAMGSIKMSLKGRT